ncbi:MAG: hypothetical protein J6U23_03555, partial [Clostridiales bacterium]|nr:hypothetical protein [Clostridiales bacterium]
LFVQFYNGTYDGIYLKTIIVPLKSSNLSLFTETEYRIILLNTVKSTLVIGITYWIPAKNPVKSTLVIGITYWIPAKNPVFAPYQQGVSTGVSGKGLEI